MPRRPVEIDSGADRIERALYQRCRRGEQEALAALLYRLVDRLYTAAAFVLPDEESSIAAVRAAWEDLLELLQRPRIGGHLLGRAMDLLRRRLLLHAEPEVVAQALRAAEAESQEDLLPLPEDALPSLVALIGPHAGAIAAATGRRYVWRKRALLGLAALSLAFAGAQVWLMTQSRASLDQVRLQCLSERIAERDLISALRVASLELGDPAGGDRVEAEVLNRASLVLEEVANAGGEHALALRYLPERVVQEELIEELHEIARGREGPAREELLQAQLALEEVANL